MQGADLVTTLADGTGQVTIDTAVTGFRPLFSPDGAYIAYEKADGLWVAPADGSGTPVHVSGTLLGAVQSFEWSPVSNTLVFVADKDAVDTGAELYVVSYDGTGLLKLSGQNVSGVSEVEFTPDGQHVAYKTDANQDWVFDLSVSSVDGLNTYPLTAPGLIMEESAHVVFSPDSSWLALPAEESSRSW